MAAIRLISYSKGQTEKITITEDLDNPASDYCPPGFTIESDSVHDINLPGAFPVNCDFIRDN